MGLIKGLGSGLVRGFKEGKQSRSRSRGEGGYTDSLS